MDGVALQLRRGVPGVGVSRRWAGSVGELVSCLCLNASCRALAGVWKPCLCRCVDMMWRSAGSSL